MRNVCSTNAKNSLKWWKCEGKKSFAFQYSNSLNSRTYSTSYGIMEDIAEVVKKEVSKFGISFTFFLILFSFFFQVQN